MMKFPVLGPTLEIQIQKAWQDPGVCDGAEESAPSIGTTCDSRAGGLGHVKESLP